MAQRYVPYYMQGGMGWNSPGIYGRGAQWGGRVMGPSIHPPQVIQITLPNQGQPTATPATPTTTNQQQQQDISVSKGNAEVLSARNTIGSSETQKSERKFRYSGMILATIASAIISLAVSNIVVTALTVLIAPDQVGCFGPPNPQYTILGPHSTLMRAFDWSWVSSGLWTSIVVFVAGNIAGTIRNLDSIQTRAFLILALISMSILIPANLVLSILDTILSVGCKDSNPTKFGTPIAIIIFTVFEFIAVTYIVVKLRQEVKMMPDSSENPVEFLSYRSTQQQQQQQLPQQQQPQRQETSFYVNPGGSSMPAPREPNVNIINIQPPSQVVSPPVIPRPYVRLNQPPPNLRWQPRPWAQPQNLLRGGNRPPMGMFSRNIYPSMVYGGYRRNAF